MQKVLSSVWIVLWTFFVVRGLVTGRMLMRGGDVVRRERPRTYAFAMAGNVAALCLVLALLAFA